MSFFAEDVLTTALIHHLPEHAAPAGERCRQIYEANRDRIYSFAFWMTGSEMLAEEVTLRCFVRAFLRYGEPGEEVLDQALLHELDAAAGVRLGRPSVQCGVVKEVAAVRHGALRVELEHAILQLPHLERMIYVMHDGDSYEHARIARTLGLTERESRAALTQARLRIRELLVENAQRATA
ncbi:MAG: sigma factor-like helix-turn-helix DNA-binding protein [Acidobacteriota bacterium]|nr:sigma factor-like helix-turn-helix DNA-binding protein [Acidobacteriota bacterium]